MTAAAGRTGLVLASLALLVALISPAAAQEDRSGLTRARFVRNCLMCHNRAAPEGVSAEIIAGLHPEPGLTPAAAMPGVMCWRRCERCFPPDPVRRK